MKCDVGEPSFYHSGVEEWRVRSEGDVVKITNGREAVRPIIQLPNSSCPASRSFIMSTVRHLSLADGPAKTGGCSY